MGQQTFERRAVAAVITDLTSARHSKTISRPPSHSPTDEENSLAYRENESQIQTQVEKIDNKRHDVVVHMVSGAMAGGVAKTTIAPLDRTKIYFQVTKQRYSAKDALSFLKESYRNHGILSLWRGNSATMARIIPYSAVQFTSHEHWKIVLHVDQPNQTKKSSSGARFLAGSLAGVTSQFLTYPLDMARARMAVTPRNTYSSLAHMFLTIWRDEGPLTLYRGFTPTLLGVIPYAGTSFGIYGTLINHHKETTKRENPNPLERMMFGAVAGLVGQTTSYPLDIVRRRMQTASVTGNGNSYKTIVGTILKVYREEGLFRGLFKGVSMNWMKGPIASGISFATFGTLKQLIDDSDLL